MRLPPPPHTHTSLHFLLLCYFSLNFLIMVVAPSRAAAAAADVSEGIKHSAAKSLPLHPSKSILWFSSIYI